MKKRMIACIVASILLLLPTTSLAATGASEWSEKEIEQAIDLNLVPFELQENYTTDITRAEFAQLAVIFAAKANGFTDINNFVNRYLMVNDQAVYRDDFFTDTDDFYVNCAKTLGIVSGREDGTFDPQGSITRQEAAVMLVNTYNTYATDKTHSEMAAAFSTTFSDSSKVASWAMDSVKYMWEWSVMNGISATEYSPLGHYTREQAIATFLRLYSSGPQNMAAGTVVSPLELA